MFKLLSQAYTRMTINSNVAASSSSIAQEANFWDPPPKNSAPTVADENLQGLLKYAFCNNVFITIFTLYHFKSAV